MSHEDDNRRKKVNRLLAVIDEAGSVTADEAASWSPLIWFEITQTANAVYGANMKPPSSVTVALVVEAIRLRERAACRCFVPPAGPGVPHEAGCPLSNVKSLAEARAKRRAS